MENLGFNSGNQHVWCLAHIINLAAQQILQTLNAGADLETDNNNIPSAGGVAGYLYKVSLINYIN